VALPQVEAGAKAGAQEAHAVVDVLGASLPRFEGVPFSVCFRVLSCVLLCVLLLHSCYAERVMLSVLR
jgi:hypothetical protein